ncbi:DUF4236 domain-containing protein [Scardovia wiggsiae]|uniref:DUF4236 domain-containing protein n=1 Tax=Scardovia wiggsiae TaxID=230143 RepID=UPI00363F40D8
MKSRYHKTIKIAGLRVNIGKKGITSVSKKIGPVTFNSKGKITTHVAPGLSFTEDLNKTRQPARAPQTPPIAPQGQYPIPPRKQRAKWIKNREQAEKTRKYTLPTMIACFILFVICGTFYHGTEDSLAFLGGLGIIGAIVCLVMFIQAGHWLDDHQNTENNTITLVEPQ